MGKPGHGRTIAFCFAAAFVTLAIPIPLFGQSGAVFWSDRQSGGIYRISGPGGQHQLIVPNAGSPWGIAVDPINRYIYWGDDDASTARKITRSNFDGSNQVIVVSEQPVSGGGSQFVEGLSLAWFTITSTSPRATRAPSDASTPMARGKR